MAPVAALPLPSSASKEASRTLTARTFRRAFDKSAGQRNKRTIGFAYYGLGLAFGYLWPQYKTRSGTPMVCRCLHISILIPLLHRCDRGVNLSSFSDYTSDE